MFDWYSFKKSIACTESFPLKYFIGTNRYFDVITPYLRTDLAKKLQHSFRLETASLGLLMWDMHSEIRGENPASNFMSIC